MSAAKLKKPVARSKKNGYKFPEKLPVGEVLKDVFKKEWVLGPSIGQGGFGEIYSAKEASGVGSTFPFVVKIEPHENGPLFVEKHFYLKVARNEDVEAWNKVESVKILGIPRFYGFGSHEYKNEKYRFVVIERYGKDIWSIFLENNRKFSLEVVCKCAIQIINVLKYIHMKGYVHADIKGANLLLGLKKGSEENIFLVDFGLSCKYSVKEFKRDPKRCHNGTIEYTSRDWHLGVPTRRGDLEILGFNLLHWIISTLPWEQEKTPDRVHQKKEEMMSNVKKYFQTNHPDVSKVLVEYLHYVSSLKPNEEPNYDLCKKLFQKELEKIGSSINGKLVFNSMKSDVGTSNTRQRVRRKKEEVSSPIRKKQKCEEIVENNSQDIDPVVIPNKQKNKKAIKKSDSENKVSWKDAPTIKASNVSKPGEYSRQVTLKLTKKK